MKCKHEKAEYIALARCWCPDCGSVQKHVGEAGMLRWISPKIWRTAQKKKKDL